MTTQPVKDIYLYSLLRHKDQLEIGRRIVLKLKVLLNGEAHCDLIDDSSGDIIDNRKFNPSDLFITWGSGSTLKKVLESRKKHNIAVEGNYATLKKSEQDYEKNIITATAL